MINIASSIKVDINMLDRVNWYLRTMSHTSSRDSNNANAKDIVLLRYRTQFIFKKEKLSQAAHLKY